MRDAAVAPGDAPNRRRDDPGCASPTRTPPPRPGSQTAPTKQAKDPGHAGEANLLPLAGDLATLLWMDTDMEHPRGLELNFLQKLIQFGRFGPRDRFHQIPHEILRILVSSMSRMD